MPFIILAFCWAHVRRDYLDAARKYPTLEEWALCWVEKIGLTLCPLFWRRIRALSKSNSIETTIIIPDNFTINSFSMLTSSSFILHNVNIPISFTRNQKDLPFFKDRVP